jgi:hypothetical protein
MSCGARRRLRVMSPEIAKLLKAAGFRPSGAGYYQELRGEQLYFPTLSELIDACAGHLESVERNNQQRQLWLASAASQPQGVTGASAEEAVARLWLSLRAGGEVETSEPLCGGSFPFIVAADAQRELLNQKPL